MRFMVMVKATKDSEAGKMPSQELLAAMAKFNEELVKAGVMLDGNGLQPSSKGARVRFSGDKRTVIDGPFAETKEVVGGFAVFEFNSREEAIESAVNFMELHKQHWPGWDGETEVRQIFGPEDISSENVGAKVRQMCETGPA